MAHCVAGIGVVFGHREREPHHGDDGVKDEGKKHVLVEGDSLAAETPGRGRPRERESMTFLSTLKDCTNNLELRL